MSLDALRSALALERPCSSCGLIERFGKVPGKEEQERWLLVFVDNSEVSE